MLVLDPAKRYSIAQIRTHRWMDMDGGCPKSAPPSPIIGYNAKVGEFNEQILRIMQSLGIDQKKTMEAGFIIFLNFSFKTILCPCCYITQGL